MDVNLKREALPSGLDPADGAAVRAWATTMVDHEIVVRGHVAPVVRIVFADRLVSAPLSGLFDVGQEAQAAACWHALGMLDGAVRRLRVGTLVVGPPGEARMAAFVMEWSPYVTPGLEVGDELPKGLPGFGARWWLAYRHFGQGGGGSGVLLGDWVQREGTNFEGLEDPFRELLDGENLTVTLPPLEWADRPALQMTTEWVMRAPGHAKPTTALGYAVDMGSLTQEEILTTGVDCLWVFAFHDEWVEWWKIRGDVPCSLDDVLRNVAQHAGAESIGALVVGASTLPDGATQRSLNSVVEFDGQRVQRNLVVEVQPNGRPRPAGVWTSDPMDVPAAERWLGVTPGYDLAINTEGIVRRGGLELAEG